MKLKSYQCVGCEFHTIYPDNKQGLCLKRPGLELGNCYPKTKQKESVLLKVLQIVGLK